MAEATRKRMLREHAAKGGPRTEEGAPRTGSEAECPTCGLQFDRADQEQAHERHDHAR
jgi:hypothetical protein